MNEVSKPLSWSMPPEKVCERLKTKDAQICELRYGTFCLCFDMLHCCYPLAEKQIDWSTIDLNKMRVKELKKILDDWGETCKACTEKSEFIKRIEELKPKFVKTEL